jgi:hypothetical protein
VCVNDDDNTMVWGSCDNHDDSHKSSKHHSYSIKANS